jgi:hypothetical protein
MLVYPEQMLRAHNCKEVLPKLDYKWKIRRSAQFMVGMSTMLFIAEKAAKTRLSTFWDIPNRPHSISSSGFCAQKLKTRSRRFEHSRFRQSSFIVWLWPASVNICVGVKQIWLLLVSMQSTSRVMVRPLWTKEYFCLTMSKTLDPLQVVLRPIQPPTLLVVNEPPALDGLIALGELPVSVESAVLGELPVLGCPIALVDLPALGCPIALVDLPALGCPIALVGLTVLGGPIVVLRPRLSGLLIGFDWSGIKQSVLPMPTDSPAS